MTNEYDVCECGHSYVIHKPWCLGIWSDGKWVMPNSEKRDCNCKEFILKETYKEPETCSECGYILDEDL